MADEIIRNETKTYKAENTTLTPEQRREILDFQSNISHQIEMFYEAHPDYHGHMGDIYMASAETGIREDGSASSGQTNAAMLGNAYFLRMAISHTCEQQPAIARFLENGLTPSDPIIDALRDLFSGGRKPIM